MPSQFPRTGPAQCAGRSHHVASPPHPSRRRSPSRSQRPSGARLPGSADHEPVPTSSRATLLLRTRLRTPSPRSRRRISPSFTRERAGSPSHASARSRRHEGGGIPCQTDPAVRAPRAFGATRGVSEADAARRPKTSEVRARARRARAASRLVSIVGHRGVHSCEPARAEEEGRPAAPPFSSARRGGREREKKKAPDPRTHHRSGTDSVAPWMTSRSERRLRRLGCPRQRLAASRWGPWLCDPTSPSECPCRVIGRGRRAYLRSCIRANAEGRFSA